MQNTSDRTKYFPWLDVLRFVAFALIFLHHAAVPESLVADVGKKLGWIGVDIFFCLSAFLLASRLMAENSEAGKLDVKKYFIRRILRIWPLYFIYLTSTLIFHLVFTETKLDYQRVLGLFTFTDNLWAAFEGYSTVIFTPHLWTISFEEQFYLILPLLVVVLGALSQKNSVIFLCIIWLLTMIIRLVLVYKDAEHPAIYTLPVTHLDPILTGLLLAVSTRTKGSLLDLLVAVPLLGTPILFEDASQNGYHLLVIYPCVAIGSAFAVRFCTWCPYQTSRHNIIVYLGRISFGLYIFHIAVLNVVADALRFEHAWVQVFLGFIATIVVAMGSYHLWEKRFLDMKRNFYATK
jgi:peptidoglycan/LPS O-acetylase OafA/YrhL